MGNPHNVPKLQLWNDAALVIVLVSCAAVIGYLTGQPIWYIATAIVTGYIAINRWHCRRRDALRYEQFRDGDE